MYMRWAERHKYPTEIYDRLLRGRAGHQVHHVRGLKGAVRLRHASAVSRGTHRHGPHLQVRQPGAAPPDEPSLASTWCRSSRRPSTWTSPDDEIRVDVFRSSGPGGQGVNTTGLGGADHPPADRPSWSPARTSGPRSRTGPPPMAVPPGPSCLSARREERGQGTERPQGRPAGRRLGLADPQLRPVSVPDGEGTPARATRPSAGPRPVLEGEIDDFIGRRDPLAPPLRRGNPPSYDGRRHRGRCRRLPLLAAPKRFTAERGPPLVQGPPRKHLAQFGSVFVSVYRDGPWAAGRAEDLLLAFRAMVKRAVALAGRLCGSRSCSGSFPPGCPLP